MLPWVIREDVLEELVHSQDSYINGRRRQTWRLLHPGELGAAVRGFGQPDLARWLPVNHVRQHPVLVSHSKDSPSSLSQKDPGCSFSLSRVAA